MKSYKQTKKVAWLPTTDVGTIWISTVDNYIQPEDITLKTSYYGVNLSLLSDEELDLFEIIPTIKIK